MPSEESQLNDKILLYGTVIPPNETHQLSMPKGWVILAEPESHLGKVISELPKKLPAMKAYYKFTCRTRS